MLPCIRCLFSGRRRPILVSHVIDKRQLTHSYLYNCSIEWMLICVLSIPDGAMRTSNRLRKSSPSYCWVKRLPCLKGNNCNTFSFPIVKSKTFLPFDALFNIFCRTWLFSNTYFHFTSWRSDNTHVCNVTFVKEATQRSVLACLTLVCNGSWLFLREALVLHATFRL